MSDWREVLGLLQARAAALPRITWAVAAVILSALTVVVWLEMADPPYVVLDDGLSPADGGKVIAQLQKLGIPYQLQAAGNVILVPAPQLAQARLQLGSAQVPGSDVSTAWSTLEDAPMTASSLAQSTMAVQALQLSLQQSIESMDGIQATQVFLALPPSTPFLADQPSPTASVVIQADAADAQSQGPAIANLVAGAVPGLSAAQVSVVTTSGVAVYPPGSGASAGTQLATVAQVEAGAQARVAGLLTALVGAGNFQTDVSADLDFTHEHTHQILYGPAHLVAHETSSLSDQWGQTDTAIGIPGALSNEPPPATTASTTKTPSASKPNTAAAQPRQTDSQLDETYVTDQSESDISTPDWTVKSIAISVVLNKTAMGAVSIAQVKTAIAGAFAYPVVNVSVLATTFQKQPGGISNSPILLAAEPLTHGLLELMAAAALLFGLAMPVGRRIAGVNLQALLPTPQRPMPVVLPPRDFSDLRAQAGENIPGVARLLQSWAEDGE